jgi:hypothetical protein
LKSKEVAPKEIIRQHKMVSGHPSNCHSFPLAQRKRKKWPHWEQEVGASKDQKVCGNFVRAKWSQVNLLGDELEGTLGDELGHLSLGWHLMNCIGVCDPCTHQSTIHWNPL